MERRQEEVAPCGLIFGIRAFSEEVSEKKPFPEGDKGAQCVLELSQENSHRPRFFQLKDPRRLMECLTSATREEEFGEISSVR
ncbi:hypothetical protein NPIL_253831 [Nephila pilipes]|uniref:Uncharacterized protein n=1 Tax=Nephila pilipes TaxID=299642 RepID=A0A8X6T4P5_NEPPI|nr:hypothetical protein NPIL_253831 [Nephila pilipes]